MDKINNLLKRVICHFANSYSLNGETKPMSTILQVIDNKWNVFYVDERGNKTFIASFETKNEAYEFLYTEYVNGLKNEIKKMFRYRDISQEESLLGNFMNYLTVTLLNEKKINMPPENVVALFFKLKRKWNGRTTIQIIGSRYYNEISTEWTKDVFYSPMEHNLNFSFPILYSKKQCTEMTERMLKYFVHNCETGNFFYNKYLAVGYEENGVVVIKKCFS